MSDEALAAYARRLRGLRELSAEAAKEAAPRLEKLVQGTAAAGTDVDGKPWPTKRDGSRALPNAAGAISAVANGMAVIVKLVGAYVFHNSAKGADRRRILPESGAGIQKSVAHECREATKRAFERLMRPSR